MTKPVKVIIDTDIGSDVDDALALAFALMRPELDVVGVTTVYGAVDERAALAAKILKTLHREDIPYAPGAARPMVGDANPLVRVNHFAAIQPGEKLPSPAASGAQELFSGIIKAHPDEVWLAAIGPMTNVGLFIQNNPETAKRLKGIVCMGSEPTRPFAEFNIRMDPQAADIVFRSGLLKFVGTYDVTKRITMNDADMARLAQIGSPISELLTECIRLWKPNTNKPGPIVYDMCPLAWLFSPEHFKTTTMNLRIELTPPERRGIAITDPNAPATQASTDIDDEAVHGMFMDTICS